MRSAFTRRTAVICVLACACLLTSAALGQSTALSFNPITQTGTIPGWFNDVKADLNNDGREDYFWGSTNSLQIELSNGDGTYAAPVAYNDPYGSPSAEVSGDFNGDGHIDIITTEQSTSGFTLFLNNGDGTFRVAARFTESAGILGMGVGDFNHDGKVDLVFTENNNANPGAPLLRIRPGDGNGGFSNGTTTTLNGFVERLWVGDFDGDGNADVMAESHEIGTGVIVAYGDGSGGVAYQTPVIGPGGLMGPADVDGDGRMDFLGSNNFYTTNGSGQTNTLSVFHANADRTFTKSTITLARCAEQGAPGIAVADFNGDGRPDIAVIEASDCQGDGPFFVSVLLRNADGSYQPEQDVYNSTDLINMATIPNIRANLDSKPDLALRHNDAAGSITTLLNTSTGDFPSCLAPVDAAYGINICSPGSSTTTTNVHFGIGAAGQTWMRKVEVWVDGTKLAEQFAHAYSHYAFMDYDTTLSAGVHTVDVYAVGWDNLLQHTSFATNVASGTGAGGCAQPTVPGVNICSPASGSTVTSPFTVSAAGRNSGTTDGLDVWLDGHKVGFYSGTTVNIQVTAGAGSHQLDIYAVGTNGELQESTVHFTVGTTSGGGGGGGTGGACSQPASPGVNICSPANGATVTSPFTISAAGRNSGATEGMDVWLDGKKVGFYPGTTVNIQVSAGTGSHQLDIYAVGTNGELQEKTVVFTVGTSSGGGGGSTCSARTTPGVTICSPADGSTVSSPVQIEAYGMNSGTTDGMDVYIDGHHTGWYGGTTHLSISVALGSGSHQLDVYAVGTNGELQESTVHFSVP